MNIIVQFLKKETSHKYLDFYKLHSLHPLINVFLKLNFLFLFYHFLNTKNSITII